MDLNTISSNVGYTANTYKSSTAGKADTAKETNSKDAAVVYEKSDEAVTSNSAKKTYQVDTATIEKLKADADARTAQLRSIVEQLISKQADTAGKSGLWELFTPENIEKSDISPETIAKAKEDVAEDGYWGVKQTSERILDFAKALTGGDPSKIDEMKKAIEKGFAAAEKMWGKELPEISKQTHEAVMKGLEEWSNQE